MTAECSECDFGDLQEPCHNGIYRTAENIFNKLKESNVLEDAFKENPVKIINF
jgi:hypothetical protein